MKILIIEDEMKVVGLLMKGLKYEGHQVSHYLPDKRGILEHLSQHDYDVIILDLMLPDTTGETLLAEIRSCHHTIPVIILTAIDDVVTKTKLLNMGADDYLAKPFSFTELVARIKAITRRSSSLIGLHQEVKVGELKLNPNLKTVTRKNKKIKLRAKEYALMEYFMKHPDVVINRNHLIESVWDYNSTMLSNTVDSHISTLRKKINTGFDSKLIQTVHGFGYVLRSKED